MWFLKGKPSSINMHGTIESCADGYQRTILEFSVDATNRVWVGIPFPWSPNKSNGSLIMEMASTDFTVWEKFKKLRSEESIDLMNVQELMSWYVENDVGLFTCWLDPGVEYKFSYRHKIAANSCLFFPTRLPTLVGFSDAISKNYSLNVITNNNVVLDKPAHLTQNGNIYSFKPWRWDIDTMILVDNWVSSDDE